jgi:hypothetical protein
MSKKFLKTRKQKSLIQKILDKINFHMEKQDRALAITLLIISAWQNNRLNGYYGANDSMDQNVRGLIQSQALIEWGANTAVLFQDDLSVLVMNSDGREFLFGSPQKNKESA